MSTAQERARAAAREWLETTPTPEMSMESISRLVDICTREEVARALEEAAKLCVFRMTGWTREDDQQSQEFREGIEKACSDLAIRIRALAAKRKEESDG